jgi:hypothetical protein
MLVPTVRHSGSRPDGPCGISSRPVPHALKLTPLRSLPSCARAWNGRKEERRNGGIEEERKKGKGRPPTVSPSLLFQLRVSRLTCVRSPTTSPLFPFPLPHLFFPPFPVGQVRCGVPAGRVGRAGRGGGQGRAGLRARESLPRAHHGGRTNAAAASLPPSLPPSLLTCLPPSPPPPPLPSTLAPNAADRSAPRVPLRVLTDTTLSLSLRYFEYSQVIDPRRVCLSSYCRKLALGIYWRNPLVHAYIHPLLAPTTPPTVGRGGRGWKRLRKPPAPQREGGAVGREGVLSERGGPYPSPLPPTVAR